MGTRASPVSSSPPTDAQHGTNSRGGSNPSCQVESFSWRAKLGEGVRRAAGLPRRACAPQASLPCEIFPSREFYDYEDKYLLDRARTIVPAELTPEQVEEIRRLAVECYQAVGGEGMARVDFLLEAATGRIYINEINTIPGFTSISMFPKMWGASGLPYPRLIDRLIELALARHAARRQTRYRR